MPQKPITDAEVLALEKQGYREGDVVPGRGRLTPMGTFVPVNSGTPAPTLAPAAATAVPTAPSNDRNIAMNSIGIALEAAKQRALEIQAGVNRLTQQQEPAQPTSTVVSSSDAVVAEERKVAEEVAQISAPNPRYEELKKASDDYLAILDDQMKRLEERREREIEGINASFDQQKRETEEAQTREHGTTNVALFKVGGYLGTQISGVGVLNNLAQTHRRELSVLESKRQAAILAAETAITDKQFDIAKLKAAEVRDMEMEIDDRRNKFFDQSMEILRETNEQEEREAKRQEFLIEQDNKIRDDARQSLNTIVSNFGGIPMEALSGEEKQMVEQMADYAGIPIEILAGKTITQKKQAFDESKEAFDQKIATERLDLDKSKEEFDRELAGEQLRLSGVRAAIAQTNSSISAARLNLSLQQFAEDEKLTALDAERLGLPRSLVGVSENEVLADLRSDTPPSWFNQIGGDTKTIGRSTDPLTGLSRIGVVTVPKKGAQTWEKFRSGVTGGGKSGTGGGSGFDYGALNLPAAIK